MSDPPHGGRIDTGSRSFRYYRNAVERHWDPGQIDFSVDRDRVASFDDVSFTQLRRLLALFGAGEEAVTEDLAPLAVVTDDIDDELFLTTQLYEEAKHADLFQRYWTEVIHPAEQERGTDPTSPADPRWFSDPYNELFERTHDAMHRLLDEDTPRTRAAAYCHYHLTVEGVLAQTGYYAAQTSFSGDDESRPELPGLVEGFSKVRSDEGRHVGFGMAKLKGLVATGAVDPVFLHDTVGDLVALVQAALEATIPADQDAETPVDEAELISYAAEKHTQRLEQITDAAADIPEIEELTRID